MVEWEWDAVLKKLTAGVRERLSGLEDLLAAFSQGLRLEQTDRQQLCEVVDLLTESLSDNNYKVSQTALQCLAHLVRTESDLIKPYANAIVPLVVERLGDTRQQVRQDACELLLSMFNTMGPQYVLQKMARFWSHRAWKVRHGLLQTVAEAIASETPGMLKSKDQNEYIITQVVNLMEDPNEAVRDAALECLQEIYRMLQGDLLENLKRQNIRSSVYKEVIARLNVIAPTDIIVPDVSPSPSDSGRLKSSQGGASNARGQADASCTVHPRSSSSRESSNSAAKAGSGGSKVPETQQVPLVHLHSEKELISEMEAMSQPLAGTTAGWQHRITCMQRLQGIAAGCTPHLQDVLLDNFMILREPMVKQVEDRRSAVSKQACQTLAALCDMYGLRFQELLLYYLPVMLRIVPITVQVMAEAADQGIRKLLYHCQTPRAIPMLVQSLKTDKNARIRSSCAAYLALAMETWDAGALGARADDFESGMKSAAQDASAEARQAARALYAGYAERMPDHAQAFLRQLEPLLADKLQSKSGAELQRKSSASRSLQSFSRPHSAVANPHKDEIIIMAPPLPRSSTFAPHSTSAAQPQLSHSMTMHGPPSSAVKPRPATASNNRPMGAGPARIEHSLDTGPQELSGGTGGGSYFAQASDQPPKPLTSSKARRSSVQAYAASHGQTSAQRVLTTPLPSRPADVYGTGPVPYGGNALGLASHRPASSPAASSHHSFDAIEAGARSNRSSHSGSVYEAGSHRHQLQQQQQPRVLMTVPKIAAALLAGPKLWSEKVELLNMLVEAVQRLATGELSDLQGLPFEPSRDLERLAPKFVECIEESHAKVVIAALEALNECIKLCAFAFDSHMERIMPCLFMRLQDQKDAVRNLSSDVIQELSVHYCADILLAGLIRALEANKQPKAKLSILEFSTTCIGRSSTAGIPTSSSMHLKQWLSRVTGLLIDKNGDLRKRATEAVEAVYHDVDAHTVVAFVQHSTGAEGMALKRLLASLQEHPSEPQTSDASHLHLPPPAPSPYSTHPAPHNLNSTTSNGSTARSVHGGASTIGNQPPRGPGALTTSYPHLHAGLPQSQPQQPQRQPCSFPIALSTSEEQMLHSRSSSVTAAGTGGGVVGVLRAGLNGYGLRAEEGRDNAVLQEAPQQPAAYHPAQYTTPYKVDPARLTAIGPIGADQDAQINGHCSTASSSSMQHSSDPAAQARLLSLLTHRLASAPSDDTLSQLANLAAEVGPGPWESVFGSLLPPLVHRVCVSPCAAHRELSMVLVHRLASHQPQLLRAPSTLQALLPVVLACEADASKEVMLSASHAAACLVTAAPPQKVLDILSAMLTSSAAATQPPSSHMGYQQGGDAESGGDVTCAACRCVQRIAHSLKAEELGPRVALDLLPGLVRACDHVRADVRKAAVFAIAEMWHKMGDASFSVHLAKLSQQQQHLVSWAYERIKLAACSQTVPAV